MKGKKKLIAVIAAVLALLMITGTVIGVVLMHHEDENNEGSPNNVKDELFVMELFHMNIEDVLNDPEWEEDLVSTTENYVMVYSDKFDFAQQIGMSDGYSYLYFDEASRDINMVVHIFIAYTNDKDSKAEIESVVSNIEGCITGLLGSASQPFMLMNTSGEFEDNSDLTLDQMIEKVIEGNTVMYTLFEANGLDYEMNIMFSDDTIYTMVWISECVEVGEDGLNEKGL